MIILYHDVYFCISVIEYCRKGDHKTMPRLHQLALAVCILAQFNSGLSFVRDIILFLVIQPLNTGLVGDSSSLDLNVMTTDTWLTELKLR